jgi:hypothetical protein
MTATAAKGAAPVSRSAPAPATRHETVLDLLTQSKRGIVPIAKTFVQQGRGKNTKPGPLHLFVGGHDGRGLEAYLFVHAVASAEPWNCDYPSGTWVRALGLADDAELASAKSAVSKVMKRLEDRGLVARTRVGRTSSIVLLKENGSGDAYEHPHNRGENWLQLPYAYWTERHYETLTLPAKATLLVALSLPDGFPLPYDRAPQWYGISADTAERGLRELCAKDLLDFEQSWIKNHRSDTGWVEQRQYTLKGAYAQASRKKAAGFERKSKSKLKEAS